MDSPFQRFRPLAGRLAEHFASGDGQVILSQLAALSGLQPGKRRARTAWSFWRRFRAFGRVITRPIRLPRVAIWQGRLGPQGLEFVRDRTQAPLWRAFAPVDCIPAKSVRKRIVLVGDSVVRGTFYDPAFTPAMALQAMLEQRGLAIEVIDLGRTAAQPAQTLALLRQLPVLQPDLLVFAGANNINCDFHKDGYPPGEVGILAAALRTGVAAFREAVRARCIDATAETIVDTLAETARRLNIPAVVVIGESNLADWRDEVPLPWLSRAEREEWQRAKDGAEAALAGEEWALVETLAERMRSLDGGLMPESGRLLGRVLLARGDAEGARRCFATARDAAGGLPYWVAPRCLGSTQDVLRRQASRHGLQTVDLPQLFAREEKIPGRKLFMDYCHLSAHGMAVATKALAEKIAEMIHFRSEAGPVVMAWPPVDRAVAATAYFLAATHNVILGQPAEMAVHHCREALRLDPEVSRQLLRYLCARASAYPDWLDAGLAAQCRTGNGVRYLSRVIHAAEGRYATAELIALVEPLLPVEWMRECREGIRRQLSLTSGARSLDLLDGRFRPKRMPLQKAAHLVEKKPRTDIVFFPPAGKLQLTLCYRTPCAAAGAAPWRILLGGREVGSAQPSREWTKLTLALPAGPEEAITETLSCVWPMVRDPTDEIRRAMIAAVDRGEAPDLYPSFGELQACRLDW